MRAGSGRLAWVIRERAASRYAFLIAVLAYTAAALRLFFLAHKSLWLLASAIAKNSAIIAGIAPGACIWFLRSSPSNSDGRLIAELRSDHDVREQANLSGVKVLLIDARGMR